MLSPTFLRALREVSLWLVLAYALWLGATQIGIVVFELNLVSGVGLSVILIGWLSWRWRRGAHRTAPPLGMLMLGGLAVMGVTAFTSIDGGRSSLAVWLLGLSVWGYWLTSDLIAGGYPRQRLLGALLVISVGLIGAALLEAYPYFAGWVSVLGWRGLLPPVPFRLAEANTTSMFFNLLIPPALALWVTTPRQGTRLLLTVWLILAGLVTYLTSSRGGWLALGIGLGLSAGLMWSVEWQTYQTRLKQLWQTRPQWVIGTLVGLGALLSAGGWLFYQQALHPSHGNLLGARSVYFSVALDIFQKHPLFGSGPFTYASSYLAQANTPPERVWVHAHGQIFETLAETGLLGFGAMTLLVVFSLKALWQEWRATPPSDRWLQAALTGAVLTVLVHSLFDVVLINYPVGFLAPLLLALTLRPRPAERFSQVGASLLGVGLVAGLGLSLWSYVPYRQGVAALERGEPQTALAQFETAAERAPHTALYRIMTAYTLGALAVEQPTYLPRAIQMYADALQLEPGYSINHANLALLSAQQPDTSPEQLQRLWQLGPASEDWALYVLNQGVAYEARGDVARAQARYARVLALRPDWARAYFFRATPLRQTLAQTIDSCSTAWLCLWDGQAQRASAMFTELIRTNPEAASGYIGRALAGLAVGETGTVESDLQWARLLPRTGEEELWRAFAEGDWAEDNGRHAEAIRFYQTAAEALLRQTAYGPGTFGATPYTWNVFRREGPHADLLPQAIQIRLTDATAQRLMRLGAWYEAAGDTARARTLYIEILKDALDNEEAKQRLSHLP